LAELSIAGLVPRKDYEDWMKLSSARLEWLAAVDKHGRETPKAKEAHERVTKLLQQIDEKSLLKRAVQSFFGFQYPQSENAVIYAFGKYCQFKKIYFDKIELRPLEIE